MLYAPTIVSAVAFYVIGLSILLMSMALLATSPVNRVFYLGKYLTPEGGALLMRSWPLVSLFALFTLSCAVEHHLHWLYENGHPEKALAMIFMGWIEAGISTITAALVLLGGVTWGVNKWRSR